MSIKTSNLFVTLAVALTLGAGLVATPAQAPDRASLIAMAQAGRVAEAWKIWESAPPSWDNLRTGVALAAAIGDVGRGLTIYTRLTNEMGTPDATALGSLAVAAAGTLTGDKDAAIAFGACGVVLREKPDHAACAPRLAGVGRGLEGVDRQALDLYRLTNGGASGPPELYASLQTKISGATRLEIATELTRLLAAERVRVLAPIFDNEADRGLRQPAASVLGEMGGTEALLALRALAGRQLDLQTRIPVLLALGQHGDPQGIDMAEQMRSVSVGPGAIDGMIALTAAGAGGAPPPQTLIDVTTGPIRMHVALTLRDRHPDVAKAAVRALLSDPSPVTRQAALRAAGVLSLGLEGPVYTMILDAQSATRLKAVHAVLQTIDQQLGRPAARP